MNEETKDPRHTANKASTITVFIIIALYCLVAMSVIAWRGIDPVGLSAGNPDNQESIFAELATPVLGPLSILMSITVLTSAFSSLNSTMISPSRTLLAMGYYKAIPEKFARVSPRFFTPTHATIVSAAAAGVFYAITRILSENALWDTITALGLMICFYYGITSLACVWYFRHECTDSVRNFLFRLLFPLFGGVALLAMFLLTAIDSMDPSYGSGNELGGIALVFVLGVGVLLIGVALMLLARKSSKDFFNGITLRTTHSADESYSAPDAIDKQIPCDFN